MTTKFPTNKNLYYQSVSKSVQGYVFQPKTLFIPLLPLTKIYKANISYAIACQMLTGVPQGYEVLGRGEGRYSVIVLGGSATTGCEQIYDKNLHQFRGISIIQQISVVFHQYETGVRSGTIKPGVGETPSQLLIFNPPPFQDLTCNHINR